jgi:hypothetical protein
MSLWRKVSLAGLLREICGGEGRLFTFSEMQVLEYRDLEGAILGEL